MTELLAATAAAFGLGLMTAISPCPLATNIAAISFVARQVDSPRKVLLAGLMYTLGRMLAYTALAALLVWTLMETPVVSQWLQKYMNKLLGPALILVGMILTGLVESSASTSVVGERTQRRAESLGLWGAGMLGVLFAMSFCPISAGWFFGSLIPMASGCLRSGDRPAGAGLRRADLSRRRLGRQGLRQADGRRALGSNDYRCDLHLRGHLLLLDLHFRHRRLTTW